MVGEVIYDVGNDNFYGLDKSGNWRSMSGPGAVISQAIADSGNGYGSSATAIRRFSNASTTGTAITYADSSTNGASFTINTSGLYSITYWDSNVSGPGYLGISKNASSLTQNIATFTNLDQKVALTYSSGSSLVTEVTSVLWLSAGDVIRAQTDGSMNAVTTSCVFKIVKIN